MWVRTRDGWRLALYRYPARHRSSRYGPVLLVHGLGANRFNMDAPVPEISLAQYLAARGHDVWVAELRGAGRSRPPGWPLTRRRTFDFDDYVQKDIPAILRRVLDDSGYPQINWVGHSMGGMLAYASMLQYDQRLFRRVVTIGSPVFTQRVLQLGLLDEQVVLGRRSRRRPAGLEVEAQPLLHTGLPARWAQVHEEGEVEHDRGGEDRVAAQEVDLDLHRVAEPPKMSMLSQPSLLSPRGG
jgi:pimeloyl-ACP methyl ester carboxylesterase